MFTCKFPAQANSAQSIFWQIGQWPPELKFQNQILFNETLLNLSTYYCICIWAECFLDSLQVCICVPHDSEDKLLCRSIKYSVVSPTSNVSRESPFIFSNTRILQRFARELFTSTPRHQGCNEFLKPCLGSIMQRLLQFRWCLRGINITYRGCLPKLLSCHGWSEWSLLLFP